MRGLLALCVVCLSATALGEAKREPEFGSISCASLFYDKVRVVTAGTKLKFEWRSHSSSTFPLLRLLADPAISDKVLRAAYHETRLAFEFPLDSCRFESKPQGSFHCRVKDNEGLTVKLQAGTLGDTFFKKADEYTGTFSSVDVRSSYSSDPRFGGLQYFISLAPLTDNVRGLMKLTSTKFRTVPAYGEAGDPQCMIDGERLVFPK